MLPALAALITVQDLDTAADVARRRLAELPAALQQLDRAISDAAAVADAARQQLAANGEARRDLEKQVAVIDGRLSRFEEHKAAVKTNQEFTALLHEIETARAGKDGLEDQILALLEDADRIAATIDDADRTLASIKAEGESTRRELDDEKASTERDLVRLAADRTRGLTRVDAPTVARYEQLLKQRRMLAVAPLQGDVCGACHVKLRPALSQHVRRNEELVTCDSCQRILYAPAKPAAADASVAPPPA